MMSNVHGWRGDKEHNEGNYGQGLNIGTYWNWAFEGPGSLSYWWLLGVLLVITHPAPQLSFAFTSPDNHLPSWQFLKLYSTDLLVWICGSPIVIRLDASLKNLDIKSEVRGLLSLKLFSHLPVKLADDEMRERELLIKVTDEPDQLLRINKTTSYSYNGWNNLSQTKINGSEGSIICR